MLTGCRAPAVAVPRERDVGGLVDQHPRVAFRFQFLLPRGEGGPDRGARGADALARLGAGGRRQRPDLGVGQRDRRPVAGMGQPGRLQLIEARGAGHGGQRIVDHALHRLR